MVITRTIALNPFLFFLQIAIMNITVSFKLVCSRRTTDFYIFQMELSFHDVLYYSSRDPTGKCQTRNIHGEVGNDDGSISLLLIISTSSVLDSLKREREIKKEREVGSNIIEPLNQS